MSKSKFIDVYNKYYTERDFDRLDLFELLQAKYNIQSALYAGSFVHVTPSLVYPRVVYVDNDKQAKRLFASSDILNFVTEHKQYPQDATVIFHGSSYTENFGEAPESVDLLISQYAGFVSQHCKQYLKIGGILLANNSHGDMSMASIDSQFNLIAVVTQRNGKHKITDNNLDDYLIPKSDTPITREHLEKIQRGIGYTKSASMYIFRRIS